MKSRAYLFELLTNNEPVSVEEYLPYEKTLKILLDNYYGSREELLVKYLGGYGTVFYIPSKDLWEECFQDYMYEREEEYNEEEFIEFSENWFWSVRKLPENPQ